jgi:hypothetical protein
MSRAYTKKVGGCLVLKKPLTLRALQANAKAGRISVNIPISLNNLIVNDINELNEYADEAILDVGIGASLSDLVFTVVGHDSRNDGIGCLCGTVILNVNADVSDII